jgi:hypothetical protein
MKRPDTDRRNRKRTPRFLRQQVTVTGSVECGGHSLAGRILDTNDGGWGVELPEAIPLGSLVSVAGDAIKEATGQIQVRAQVVWCIEKGGHAWRVGLRHAAAAQEATSETHPESNLAGVDHYEVMQLSPNADQDTVHRVYRLLAQRFHPDNQESGDSEAFRRLLEAYKVLGDPEKRAGYDADHQSLRRRRWKIFDQPKVAQGIEAEKRKRAGILGLLYAKRSNEPAQPAMTLFEIEDLLGVPREHLEFSLWYLKENSLISRADNAKYGITIAGVNEYERQGPVPLRPDRLLPEPSPHAA